MDFIKEYKNAVKSIQQQLKNQGKKGTLIEVAAGVGAEYTYFTNKLNGKEGAITEIDLV